MLNALKKIDKKFLIIVGLIFLVPIIIIIFLAIIQGCGTKKITYSAYEKRMVSAFEKYITETNQIPKDEGELVAAELSTLVDKGYIKSAESLVGDSSCTGNVSVRRNGSSIKTNNGGFLNYIVDLQCDKYSTIKLIDKLKEELVIEDAGLYADGEGYIFKGKKVNNYISFFGHEYRIISIDKNGMLKLLKSESELNNRIWDNKYNIETSSFSGKNIYKDSMMLEYLINDYTNTKKISTKAKQYVVAHDACIGKRNNSNYSIDTSVDCSEILEKQVISLLNVSDYAKASLDSNCVSLNSRSCVNYNYLYGVLPSTWTLNASLDNSYEVMYLIEGAMKAQSANTYNVYNFVIYIDGNQMYTSGSGTKIDPYIVG